MPESPAVTPATDTPDETAPDDGLHDLLGDTFFACTRDWSAWSYRTMGEDDFVLLRDDEDVLADFREWRDKATAALRDDTDRARATVRDLMSAIGLDPDQVAETSDAIQAAAALRDEVAKLRTENEQLRAAQNETAAAELQAFADNWFKALQVAVNDPELRDSVDSEGRMEDITDLHRRVSELRGVCTGADDCAVPVHVHGCYADQCATTGTGCDEPETAPPAGSDAPDPARTWSTPEAVPQGELGLTLQDADGDELIRIDANLWRWTRVQGFPVDRAYLPHRWPDPELQFPVSEVPAPTGEDR